MKKRFVIVIDATQKNRSSVCPLVASLLFFVFMHSLSGFIFYQFFPSLFLSFNLEKKFELCA
jgi:hypothetical protein